MNEEKKQLVKDFLRKQFDYIYCETCRFVDTDNCDYCHRKAMNWSISDNAIDDITKKILDIIGE